MKNSAIDCVVCGSCTVDILVKPAPLRASIGTGTITFVDAIEVMTGGLVSNAGIAMARLGMQVAAFSYTGNDEWSSIIRRKYQAESIDLPNEDDGEFFVLWLDQIEGNAGSTHAGNVPNIGLHVADNANRFMIRYNSANQQFGPQVFTILEFE